MAGFVGVPGDIPAGWGSGTKHPDKLGLPAVHPPPPLIPLASSNSYLTFQSSSWQKLAGHPREEHNFYALCGDDPPTITGGYAKWNTIDRPLRQGVTLPTGFDPAQIKISIRLGIWDGRFNGELSDGSRNGSGWDTRSIAAEAVERNCNDLHWMAGGNFEAGPGPIVYVDSYDRSNPKARTNLMPKPYRGVAWVISGGIEWGNSLRHPNGSRVYQDAVFTLLGYTSFGTPPPPQTHEQAGGFYVTNAHVRTALTIATAPSTRSLNPHIAAGLARAILASPRNNPCRSSRIKLARYTITQQLPLKLHVWVPAHPG